MAETFEKLRDLLIHELRDLYDAEHQLLDALPEMAEAANDQQLREAFQAHLAETEDQIDRLITVFEQLDEKPKRVTCKAMKGLIKEGSEAVKAKGDAVVADLALIAAAQRVEHYEIAGYGTARTMARMLLFEECAEELQATLEEEAATDEKLTQLALALYQQTA